MTREIVDCRGLTDQEMVRQWTVQAGLCAMAEMPLSQCPILADVKSKRFIVGRIFLMMPCEYQTTSGVWFKRPMWYFRNLITGKRHDFDDMGVYAGQHGRECADALSDVLNHVPIPEDEFAAIAPRVMPFLFHRRRR